MMNNKEFMDGMTFLQENTYGINGPVLNESSQNAVVANALNKMLDLTLSKYSKLDYTDIEKCRGDATQCKFYANLNESINILCDINEVTNKIPASLTVSNALENLVLLKPTFQYAFRAKNELGIILFNTMFYATMEATSYLISASINFVKDGEGNAVVSPYEVNGRDVLVINNLDRFNKCCADGTVTKYIKGSYDVASEVKANEAMTESIDLDDIVKLVQKGFAYFKKDTVKETVSNAFATVAFIYVAINIVPLVQSIAHVWYKAKHTISQSAEVQAEFIQMNIDVLRRQGADDKVIAKQQKAADKFERIAQKFALDYDKANRDAKAELQNVKVDSSAVIL